MLLIKPASVNAKAEMFRVAVASNFSLTLKHLRKDFKEKTGVSFTISQSSTGKLFAQIVHGAPYDIFLSADEKRPDILFQKGLAYESFIYAEGLLVFVARKKSGSECRGLLSEYLNDNTGAKIAIANPKTAPYGMAAAQVLKFYGKLNELSSVLVRGESILQTFQFVMSGSANSGFIAKSLVMQPDDSGLYCYLPLARKLYQPIRQKMVVLKRAKGKAEVQLFLDYMKSKAAKRIIKENGYFTN